MHCQQSLSMATSSGNRTQSLRVPQGPDLKDSTPDRFRLRMIFHLHASHSKVVVVPSGKEVYVDVCT